MSEHPDNWLRKPRSMAGVFYYWARGKRLNAAAYPPNTGPDRETMMRTLGLDYRADLIPVNTDAALAA